MPVTTCCETWHAFAFILGTASIKAVVLRMIGMSCSARNADLPSTVIYSIEKLSLCLRNAD